MNSNHLKLRLMILLNKWKQNIKILEIKMIIMLKKDIIIRNCEYLCIYYYFLAKMYSPQKSVEKARVIALIPTDGKT